jgi:hypothetical protein
LSIGSHAVVSSGIAKFLCEFLRGPDVLILRALVAADEQEDDQCQSRLRDKR